MTSLSRQHITHDSSIPVHQVVSSGDLHLAADRGGAESKLLRFSKVVIKLTFSQTMTWAEATSK